MNGAVFQNMFYDIGNNEARRTSFENAAINLRKVWDEKCSESLILMINICFGHSVVDMEYNFRELWQTFKLLVPCPPFLNSIEEYFAKSKRKIKNLR